MFLRTILLGILGAIGGAIAFVIVAYVKELPSFEGIQWPSLGGFIAGVFVNLLGELGLYKVNLLRRLLDRKRD